MGGVQERGEQRIWPLLQHLRAVQLCNLADARRRRRRGRLSNVRGAARVSFLSHLATVHDEDSIRVRHSVDPVGDGEHGAVPEGLLDGVLDQSVRLRVDGRCRLVQENNLAIVVLVRKNKAATFPWKSNATFPGRNYIYKT